MARRVADRLRREHGQSRSAIELKAPRDSANRARRQGRDDARRTFQPRPCSVSILGSDGDAPTRRVAAAFELVINYFDESSRSQLPALHPAAMEPYGNPAPGSSTTHAGPLARSSPSRT